MFANGSGIGTIHYSFQGVDASGNPNGTFTYFREMSVPTSLGWLETDIISDDGTDTGNLITVTQGDLLAFVAVYSARTSGNFIPYAFSGFGLLGFPYVRRNAGSGWTRTGATSMLPNLAIKYDDDTYDVPRWGMAMNAITGGTTTVTTTSDPDEVGVGIIPPWDCTSDGAFLLFRPEAPVQVTLYDSGGTELASCVHDQDVAGFAGVPGVFLPAVGGRYYWVTWDTPVDLVANETYYLTVKATDTGDVEFYDYPHESADILAVTAGSLNGSLVTRSSGVFTVSATEKGVAAVHLTQIAA